jgi:hypothetical protein
MNVRIIYSAKQLDATVKYIAKYNSNFKGQHAFIRQSLLNDMKEIALAPLEWTRGTMGYMISGDREDEGIDSDENIIRFDILVDPALALDAWDLDDMVEEVVSEEENDSPATP